MQHSASLFIEIPLVVVRYGLDSRVLQKWIPAVLSARYLFLWRKKDVEFPTLPFSVMSNIF